MAYKMNGHSLPGPNQKSSPNKVLGIAALTTAMIAKAAIGGAVSAGVSKGISAISKAKTKKTNKKNEAIASAKDASDKSIKGMGDIGAKTNITEDE